MKNRFLPIGSIVKLKTFQRRLMITGIMQYVKERPDTVYDYIGVIYPEGETGGKIHWTFNNADIDEVVFRGYEDELRDKFFKFLEYPLKKNQETENPEKTSDGE